MSETSPLDTTEPYTLDKFESHVDQLFLNFFEAARFSSTIKTYPIPEDQDDPKYEDKILDIFRESYTSLNNLHGIHKSDNQLSDEIVELNKKIQEKKKSIEAKKNKLLELNQHIEETVIDVNLLLKNLSISFSNIF